MIGRFRQSMNWLHTWAGFSFAWLLYFIFITGSLGYFENEIDRWMKPELAIINQAIEDEIVLKIAEKQLQQYASKASQWYISYPSSRDPYIKISWLQQADPSANISRQWYEKNVDVLNGKIREVRSTSGGEKLYRLHYNLHYIPLLAGYVITSIGTMVMLIALVTGVIIHRKIFIELFTFRSHKGLRSWLDIHNIFSVLPLPFHFMITYSGLVLLMGVTMAPVIDSAFGEGRNKHQEFYELAQQELTKTQFIDLPSKPLTLKTVLTDAKSRFENKNVSYLGIINKETGSPSYEVWFEANEGIEFATQVTYNLNEAPQIKITVLQGKAGRAAKVYDVLEHLHEGLFAGTYLRWLYFISGLFGAGMVASGTIIWLKKKLPKETNTIPILARLNTGVTVGLLIAIACYFISNRLLPVSFIYRAQWEMHSLFIALISCILFSALYKGTNLWSKLLFAAALLYVFIPVLNALTTEHNLAFSFIHQDWLMLGFDITMLVTGILLFISATYIDKSKHVNFN